MSRTVSTSLTDLFGLTIPIVSAPMAYATTSALVAEVIKAGGLGFLGAGNEPAPKIAQAIDQAHALVGPEKQHLVSVGFVGWILDKFNTEADPRLRTVLEKAPAALFLSYGQDLGKYVAQIRAFDAPRTHKTRIFVTVNTVAEAVRAADEWKADVLVVQGAEAGGRGSIYSPPTTQFVEETLKVIPSGLPVLAAGGITTGSQIAAGVVLGTRLLFTPECMFSDEMKDVLVKAGPGATGRSPAYDLAFPPGVWPTGIEARCVTNSIVKEYEAGLKPAERKANLERGDREHLFVYAGVGVADVSEIRSTADVMKSLHGEAVRALQTAAPDLLR